MAANRLQTLEAYWRSPLSGNNLAYTVVFLGAAGLSGNAAMVLLVGAIFWAIVSIGLYRFEPLDDRQSRTLGLVFGLLVGESLLQAIVHWGDSGTLDQLLVRLPFLGFFPIVSRLDLSDRRGLLTALETGALVGSCLALVVVLFQMAAGVARPASLNGNPNILGFLAAIFFGIQIVAATRRRATERLLYVGGFVAAAFCLVVAGTRAYWPILVLGPVIAAWVTRSGDTIRSRMAIVLSAAFLLIIAAGLAGDRFLARIPSEFGFTPEVSDQDMAEEGAIGKRWTLWQCGIEAFAKAPAFGLGVSEARRFMAECTVDLGGQRLRFSHFHNFLFDAAAKGGIADVMALLAVLVAPFWTGFRNLRRRDVPTPELHAAIRALNLLVPIIFVSGGMFGIFVGSDVHSAVFIYLAACLYVLSLPARDGGLQERLRVPDEPKGRAVP